MDEKKLMRAIGIVGELQTDLLARYWNADKVFKDASYKLAKQIYFKEMEALKRLDSAIRYALLDDKQLTWDEYNNLVFHNNPCLLIRDVELCRTFTRLCEVGVAKRNYSLKDPVDTEIQSEASHFVNSQSGASCAVHEVMGKALDDATDLQVLKWALEMLRKIEERRTTKLKS